MPHSIRHVLESFGSTEIQVVDVPSTLDEMTRQTNESAEDIGCQPPEIPKSQNMLHSCQFLLGAK